MYFVIEHIVIYWLMSWFIMKRSLCIWEPTCHMVQVLGNQLFLTPIVIWLSNIQHSDNLDHSYFRMSIDIVFAYICQCVAFYIIHRILHIRRIYNSIHIIHHSYILPVPWAAFFCHPAEHLFANLIPIFIGPILLHSNINTTRIWSVIATVNAVIAHSGSMLKPSVMGTHDVHHKYFNCNFGTGLWMDRLFGTEYLEHNVI